MERSTHAIKNGKPSISMGHGFHGYLIKLMIKDGILGIHNTETLWPDEFKIHIYTHIKSFV